MSMKYSSYLNTIVLLFGLVVLTGCSTINKVFDNKESVNYKTAKTVSSLEVPPDLTNPQYDSTFEVNSGKVSASTISVNSNAVPNDLIEQKPTSVRKPTNVKSKASRVAGSVHERERVGKNIDSDGYGVGKSIVAALSKPKKVRRSGDTGSEKEKTGRNIDSDGYGVGRSVAAPSAKLAVSSANTNGQPSLKISGSYDNVWDRTGVALKKMGFTLDGQDKEKGLYAVKWAGYSKEGKNLSEQLQQMLSFQKEILEEGTQQLVRVSNAGEGAVLQIFDRTGDAVNLDVAKKVLDRLRKELSR